VEHEIEGFITVPEAAERLSRSTEQVRRYLREGKLAGRRIGNQWFIRQPAVLYQTRPEQTETQRQADASESEGRPAMSGARMELYERIRSHREEIRRNWEAAGVHIDAAELVRELREEEVR
jgi:excisionase family DNA binding protein